MPESGPAIVCALALAETLKVPAIEVRAGIRTGEIKVRSDDVVGMAGPHRCPGLGLAGEVLV